MEITPLQATAAAELGARQGGYLAADSFFDGVEKDFIAIRKIHWELRWYAPSRNSSRYPQKFPWP